MKTLYFEGAGMDFYEKSDIENSDVGNHRIRTAFRNDEGAPIYLEMFKSRVEKKDKRKDHQGYKEGQLIAWVDHCHIINLDKLKDTKTPREHYTLPCERKVRFLYTLEGIREFVNKELNCSFDKVEVLDTLEWYHVHTGNREQPHNFMEDHIVNPARTKARKEKVKQVDEWFRFKFGSKYSVMSIEKIENDDIHIRLHVSDTELDRYCTHRKHHYSIEGMYECDTQSV